MTRFWLMRHGQTDWNQQSRYQGHADPPLNSIGRAQADSLAAKISEKRIAALYSSDLKRALETARIIASRVGLEVRVDTRLREMKLGEWEGMFIEDIIAQYPEEWAMRKLDPANARPPGGESLIELSDRVWSFAEEVTVLHPKDQILVVSHGMAIAALYCRAKGMPIGEAYKNIPNNADFMEIEL